jgi:MerR family redox-sensitive transcriptional activator SoxR
VYEPAVLDRLAVIALLQRAGFTVAEMRTFLTDFPADAPPSERWQALASRKLPEVEALIVRATAMKDILERGLRCECPTMEECARAACAVPTDEDTAPSVDPEKTSDEDAAIECTF